ncbi:hypothetical protein VTH06DRAFT_8110 [Thermothelomyces fergusii]
MTLKKLTASPPAPGAPYYTPAQTPLVGTALDTGAQVPTLFTPLKLREVTLQNRFAVSPMCMYSADDGHLTDWHLVHLGAYALRGAALTIVEATAVTANGRITPEDAGLWQDSQVGPLRRVVDFVHSQGQKIAVQLAHAGRKASTLAPWHGNPGGRVAGPDVGGWPDNLWAPSPIPWDDSFPTPKEMTADDIKTLVRAFADAARRALQAGVDAIEIHSAHGYLLSEFLSPITNQRTDEYGGSFENRVRLLLEIVRAVRAAIPEGTPLLVRISATEWMEHAGGPSWDLAQSKRLAPLLAAAGVDLLDVSSGGNNPRQKIRVHPYYQADLAGEIRAELRRAGASMAIGAVGLVTSAEMARSLVQEDGSLAGPQDGTVEVEGEHGTRTKADLVLVGRQFLREPEFVLKTAAELGVDVQAPHQYRWATSWKKHL